VPYAKQHGLEIIELAHPRGTLYQKITGDPYRGYLIPAYFVSRKGNIVRGRRQCTSEQKVDVIDKWLRDHGGKAGSLVGLGISADEADRVKPNVDEDTMAWKTLAWPLLFDVPRPYTRQDCVNVIEDAGIPVPPRSACKYCPYHQLSYWQDLRTNSPVEFWQMVALEKLLGDRQVEHGQPRIFFTRLGKPLDKITTEEFNQPTLFGDMCESGYCMV